jgi:hypothetical protein
MARGKRVHRVLAAADDRYGQEAATLDKAVHASHDQAQARVGVETGSPVTALDDGPERNGPVHTES